MTKKRKLYDLFQSLARDEIKEDFTVKYYERDGWYLVPVDIKYFNANGVFLGATYQTAEQYMKSRDFMYKMIDCYFCKVNSDGCAKCTDRTN